jgi:hypothetical protein
MRRHREQVLAMMAQVSSSSLLVCVTALRPPSLGQLLELRYHRE